MSPRLPALSGKDMIRALQRGDFSVVRVKGSHHVVHHCENPARRTVVPVLGNETLGRGLARQILKDLDLSVEEFLTLL